MITAGHRYDRGLGAGDLGDWGTVSQCTSVCTLHVGFDQTQVG